MKMVEEMPSRNQVENLSLDVRQLLGFEFYCSNVGYLGTEDVKSFGREVAWKPCGLHVDMITRLAVCIQRR